VTGGTRGEKSGLGKRWNFRKPRIELTPLAREAPVSWQKSAFEFGREKVIIFKK